MKHEYIIHISMLKNKTYINNNNFSLIHNIYLISYLTENISFCFSYNSQNNIFKKIVWVDKGKMNRQITKARN